VTSQNFSTAFVDTNVLSMVRNETLPHQTVIVRDGKIAVVGPSDQVQLPPDAVRVEGAHKFLMPGLCDMHVHIVPMGAEQGVEIDEAERRAVQYLLVFLASGITTVRNMAGTPLHLRLRARVASGSALGPRICTAGPILETRFTFPELADCGQLVRSRQEARTAVAAHHRAGYDFIKVYNDIDAEIYDEIVATARSLGMPVVGHVAFAKGLSGALAARQDSIEHLRSYDFAADTRPSDIEKSRFEGWLHTSARRIAELAEMTAAAGTWNVPTLVIERALRTDAELGQAIAPVDLPVPHWLAEVLKDREGDKVFTNRQREAIKSGGPIRGAMVKALDDIGAGVLAGSDCPGCRLVPGRSLLRELEFFVEAGLSPWRALRTATVQAATFLGATDCGTIEVGKRADLLLLDADPREEISALRRQSGVMVAGRWLDSEALSRVLLEQAIN
jgi:imidazolonepropionase-like amidohydrolase